MDEEFLAYRYKTDFMRALLRAVSRGNVHYVQGEVPRKKAEALVFKFIDRYAIDASKKQRWLAKRNGVANTRLLTLAADTDVVSWVLLATPGEGLIHQLESLNHVSQKRLSLTGYEIAKMPKKNSPASWTWRMQKDTYEAWHERLTTYIRHNDMLGMEQSMNSLQRVPVFAEVRKQAYALAALAKGEWQRVQAGEYPFRDFALGWYGKHQTADRINLRTGEILRELT
ncbi:hypothetical protein WH50_06385 [Pokkaliibacter plantistimulans]|uniref:Uncharacterized protein n=1 Tax=Pokkaliibacter plantistimulans TaxID=1635171 RepID=A0ABX5LZG7_9GAMM|nr:hypothetical protein [Pokkaliibacter plantistimulans]PXF32082.1 hypothetical protein WH50_06385 [Pokkaliibacter plantistimulans]